MLVEAFIVLPLVLPDCHPDPMSFDLIGRGEGAPSNGVLRLFDRFEHGILAPLVENRVI